MRTALNHLKSTNEITIDVTNRFSVVTVVNWESYQLDDGEVTNETTNKRADKQPTTNQQLTNNQPHLKNDKNIRKQEIKKDIYSQERLEIINYLNELCGTSYRPNANKTKELINARLREKFTVDDFKTVIYKKAMQWKDDSKMCKFLRPETLFGTKFEGYLNEKSAVIESRWEVAF